MLQETVKAATVGHSFALAFGAHAALVVETTGWERVDLPDDPPLSAADIEMYRALPSLHLPDARLSVCGLMPPATENRVYERVLLGHGCVYFTRLPEQQQQHAAPEYGARIADIRAPSFCSEWRHTAPPPQRAFTMRTRDFLLQLCADESVPVRLFPPMAGARAMIDAYDAMQAELPQMRRCLRPPPRLTSEFEDLMCAHWASLASSAGPNNINKTSAGVYFSLRAEAADATAAAVRARWPGARIRQMPFMRSCVFHISAAP